MRFSSAKILWLVGVAALASLAALSQQAAGAATSPAPAVLAADQAAAQSARKALKISDMMSFETFKQRFHKHYDSLVTALARQKLFFARAFRAIISAINYKRGARASYLSINQFSDWTPVEFSRTLIKLPILDDAGQPAGPKQAPERQSVESIEREARLIGEQQAQLAAQLREAEAQADPNAADKRQAPVEALVLQPEAAAGAPAQSPRKPEARNLKSNNPEYQQPELMSEGAGDQDDTENAHMAADQASYIGRLPGLALLSQAAGSVFTWLGAGAGGDGEPAEVEPVDTVFRSSQPDELFYDHRRSGCLNEIRSQGNCGSCYIFSAVALYEYAYCMDTGSLASLSEQYIIDCGPRANLNGCEGGQPWNVANFIKDFGLELRSHYPYRTKQDTCPYSESQQRSMGFLHVEAPEMRVIRDTDFEQYVKLGPFNFNMLVPSDFAEYGGGVMQCETENLDGGHAMVAIGSGRENGEEYWLVRNSHGVWWGEQGHLKVSKRSICSRRIEHSVLLATATNSRFFRHQNGRYDSRPVVERYSQYMAAQ